MFDIERPTVGLLNVGVEEVKGIEEVKAGLALLQGDRLAESRLSGFCRRRRSRQGDVDVFVTEGFTGNIALKTAEGTAKQIGAIHARRDEPELLTKLGYLLARDALSRLAGQNGPGPRQRRRVPRP